MRPSTSRISSNQSHRPSSNCKAAAIRVRPFAPSRGMAPAYFGIIHGIFEVIMRNRQSGFTLIEIMVVVVILAVLGALVVPQILSKVDQARTTAAKTDIRTISAALDSYRLDNFKYPTTEQGLQALVKQPADPTITYYAVGGYLKSVPKDPWGNPYQYQTPGADGRDYDITSYGRDGKPGGEGPDADISTSTLEQR